MRIRAMVRLLESKFDPFPRSGHLSFTKFTEFGTRILIKVLVEDCMIRLDEFNEESQLGVRSLVSLDQVLSISNSKNLRKVYFHNGRGPHCL